MKIVEWPPPSVNEINFKTPLCGFLPKNLIQETIREPGGSVGTQEEPQVNLTSLQEI